MNQPTETHSVSWQGLLQLWALIRGEARALILALMAVVINSGLTVLAPILIAYAIDTAIAAGNLKELLQISFLILLVYLLSALAAYQQVLQMGAVGQRVLYRLRERVFLHIQSLSLAFFLAQKAGDLISRINNDTQKLNQFFSETLVRLFGNFFVMGGAAICMLGISWRLGLVALLPVLLIVGFTRLLTPWVRRANRVSLQQQGLLSGHIQESLSHFKVFVAFNRRDHFRAQFAQTNYQSYRAARQAGIANQIFTPAFDFIYHLATMAVLAYGILLVSQDTLTVGLLIAYFTYLTRFYEPVRQIASLWASLQLALASWERVEAILKTPVTLPQLPSVPAQDTAPLICFDRVSFAYTSSQEPVLHEVNFTLEAGKTYAFVGPTGGGKSTTAALMARLYDPSAGQIRFQGRDLRSLTPEERASAMGFILQEPFLFGGSLAENVSYGHPQYQTLTPDALGALLKQKGLAPLLGAFESGLETVLGKNPLSLGQQQLVAFMRAVIRDPQILILDEATANIDTVTEQLLEQALNQLPPDTTRVLIAHRLNTIANADQIFFVNAGKVMPAGHLDEALALLQTQTRQS